MGPVQLQVSSCSLPSYITEFGKSRSEALAVLENSRLTELFWLQSGLSNQGLTLDMPTGRLDGFVSSAAEANSLLVSSQSTAEQLTQQFAQQGFSQDEMITLSGKTYEANAPSVAASVMLQVFPSWNNK